MSSDQAPEHPPSAPPPGQPKPRLFRTRVWGAGRFLLLAIGLSFTFGAFFLTGMRVANHAREVTVPNLAGQSVAEANRSLAAVGLVLKVDQRRADAKIPADHVITQEPEPGAILRRQRAIRVRVSEGARDPLVPVVVGQVERTAEISLAQDGVQVAGRAAIKSDTYDTGVVVAQDPPAQGHGAKLSLLVNEGDGDARYVMPDVVGTSGGRVIDILRRHGFRVTLGAEPSLPGLPSGIVVKQTPQAGAQVAEGAAVVLEVNR